MISYSNTTWLKRKPVILETHKPLSAIPTGTISCLNTGSAIVMLLVEKEIRHCDSQSLDMLR